MEPTLHDYVKEIAADVKAMRAVMERNSMVMVYDGAQPSPYSDSPTAEPAAAVPVEPDPEAPSFEASCERVFRAIGDNGAVHGLTVANIATNTSLPRERIAVCLKKLRADGRVIMLGKARGAMYAIPNATLDYTPALAEAPAVIVGDEAAPAAEG